MSLLHREIENNKVKQLPMLSVQFIRNVVATTRAAVPMNYYCLPAN